MLTVGVPSGLASTTDAALADDACVVSLVVVTLTAIGPVAVGFVTPRKVIDTASPAAIVELEVSEHVTVRPLGEPQPPSDVAPRRIVPPPKAGNVVPSGNATAMLPFVAPLSAVVAVKPTL